MADDLVEAHASAVAGIAASSHAAIYGEGARMPMSLERFNAGREERAKGTGAKRLGTFLETASAGKGGNAQTAAGVITGMLGRKG